MPISSTNDKPILIDANLLLLGKFPEPRNEYQHGWNDALQTAFDVETEVVLNGSDENHDSGCLG